MGEHMYKLFTNTSYAGGIRVLFGQTYREFPSYEEAIATAIDWLKQNPNKGIMDVCIMFEGVSEQLEIGQRYDIYRGILAHSGKTILFDEIVIQKNPYKVTGIYRGTDADLKRMEYSHLDKCYIELENKSGFSSIVGADYGEIWEDTGRSMFGSNRVKWDVLVGASQLRFTPCVGWKVAEFYSKDEARWRSYEMILSGWEASSTGIIEVY